MQEAEPIFGRVLLTNDDGIDAPGLRVLEEVAATLAREVWVVAPEHDQSGTSHSISLHSPLRVSPKGERRFAVRGTPGDCVVMGVRHLLADGRPDMILSGVNRGANLGVETVFSGTVGAAMTAMLLGLPALALSQAFSDGNAVPWDTARALAPGVIRRLAGADWSRNACLNINFPTCPADRAGPVTLTRQGAGLLDDIEVVSRTDPRNFTYHWLRLHRSARQDAEQSETAVVAAGGVSVTPLRFERTHEETLVQLRNILG
ncbi:5'-nucleotidase SurE 1 [Rhodovastum atsumiense]|uniref:5'-nucleotidase SurE n=1 Tax=Rhodovastum atsumiense TaxID=504468 RepID=A0A5M6IWC2_9PROT|nr:5'/3'-nucleotidase SurE [Rhodovastum atsumiense]KAA5612626.1 5'/3'-nucleotidase SurE [Rhodovastum atsumiense]CAH2601271.1 5'-nucleotidase SurE 1 [Rhodovastum atsumiense]